jgi:hypothetical protein
VGNNPVNVLDPSGLAKTLPRSQWPKWVKNLPGQDSGRDADEGGSPIREVTDVAEDLQHEGGGHYDVYYIEEGTGAERKQRYYPDGTPFTDEENERIVEGGTSNWSITEEELKQVTATVLITGIALVSLGIIAEIIPGGQVVGGVAIAAGVVILVGSTPNSAQAASSPVVVQKPPKPPTGLIPITAE